MKQPTSNHSQKMMLREEAMKELALNKAFQEDQGREKYFAAFAPCQWPSRSSSANIYGLSLLTGRSVAQ